MAKGLVITLIFIEGIFLLFVILSAIGKVHFKRKASKEAGRLLEASPEKNTDKIRKEDLLALPHPVQKWLIEVSFYHCLSTGHDMEDQIAYPTEQQLFLKRRF